MSTEIKKTEQTVCRRIRLEMGYSIGEFAELLGISKGTYQGYDMGTRKVPEHIEIATLEALEKDRAFMGRYKPGGEFDQELDKMYPHGIVSEI